MGTGLPLLLLLLGCFMAGSCGATDSPVPEAPLLEPAEGDWLLTPLPSPPRTPPSPRFLSCRGRGPVFLLFRRGSRSPVEQLSSPSGRVFFSHRSNGSYTCRWRDGNVTSPPSNTVHLLAVDARLQRPQLWATAGREPREPPEPGKEPPAELRVPEGSEVSVACRGPPGAATFRLFRGNPGRAAGWRRAPAGGTVRFVLGPLGAGGGGSFRCTYSPERGGGGGGGSPPSHPQDISVGDVEGPHPNHTDWPGCQRWAAPP